jgi:hypothetical protein
MNRSQFLRKLPGYVGTGLLVVTTTLWTFWGVGEMYYEGWWGAWHNRLPYLGPPALCLALTWIALTWPRIGGGLILLIGGTFTAWRWARQAQLGGLTLRWMLGWFPISGLLVVVGVLFVLEGRYRQQRRAEGRRPPVGWLGRNLRYVIAFAPPLLTALSVTAFFAPLLLARFDDGDRGARLIRGNGVTLVWAPKGPGWNWHPLAGRGRRPSWDDIALYGVPPVGIHEARKIGYDEHATQVDMQTNGLCRYLSADGTTLMPEPQGVWRMPTADEVVRSLVRRGENAGCTWDGASTSADCPRQPNKDAPLWAADESPIYYWAAGEYDAQEAWYVPYTGGGLYGGVIGHQPKSWGNARHGYRCVRFTRPGS